MTSKHINVYGIVQDVFFRQRTKEKANALGIKGWVRNCEDGTVEIEAEGTSEALDEFVKWCHTGPPRAVVNKVEVSESPIKNFTSFEIAR
jgi:acylphosphatase